MFFLSGILESFSPFLYIHKSSSECGKIESLPIPVTFNSFLSIINSHIVLEAENVQCCPTVTADIAPHHSVLTNTNT